MKHNLSIEKWLGNAVLALAALGLAACFNPSYDQPRCGLDQACPSGLTCVADVCVKNPSIGNGDPDGGPQPGPDGPRPDAPMIDAPPAVAFPSCVGLAKTCGPNGNSDCCESPMVPGGTYFRSYTAEPAGDQNAPATLSSFRLDKYEVTVGRFRAFVEAGMGTQLNPPANGSGAHARIANSGWNSEWNASLPTNQAQLSELLRCGMPFQKWTDVPGDDESAPINCLNWFIAAAFCIWDDGYLPTEAEWNYAAVGGDQHRIFPWSVPPNSATINGDLASYHDGINCVGDGMPGCGAADVVRVGSKPNGAGRWGHTEMAGNVYEWILDWYAPYQPTCMDCAQVTSFNGNVAIRGGYYSNDASVLRGSFRPSTPRDNRHSAFGVRCARPVTPPIR